MNRGFTLIEMIVSVAIFAVVMTVALSSLLAISESDRKAQTLKAVINNLNFSVDSMTRAMRTGTTYHCDAAVLPLAGVRDCDSSPGASSVAFLQSDGITTTVYCLGSGTACSSSGTSVLRSLDGGTTYAPITAPEVTITNLQFYVSGSTPGDHLQPKIVILLSGSVQVNPTQTSTFNLQTSVTERLYDK